MARGPQVADLVGHYGTICTDYYGWDVVRQGRQVFVFCNLTYWIVFFREMKRRRGENGGERKTKWLPLDVETKRRRGQIIYKM